MLVRLLLSSVGSGDVLVVSRIEQCYGSSISLSLGFLLLSSRGLVLEFTYRDRRTSMRKPIGINPNIGFPM